MRLQVVGIEYSCLQPNSVHFHKKHMSFSTAALIQSFLAYNDGILINANFETSDPLILAAGPAAIYEKKLQADELCHAHYCSYEVGRVVSQLRLSSSLPLLCTVKAQFYYSIL